MPDKLLITGGAQRDKAVKLGEGRRYHSANLIEIDFESGDAKCLVTVNKANDHYPDDCANITFTSCSLENDLLYLCTETEIFLYSYPELKLLKQASFPFLQNMHHIAPVVGRIGVASTGLDLVVLLDPETLEPEEFFNSLGKDPWHRFSANEDYRKINSTKPHESHPNFVFELNNQLWTTRFNQKDAVCLQDMSKRIEIGLERIHDGHVIKDKVYFTCVDGKIIIVDAASQQVEKVIDLNQIENNKQPLGWCRGLLIEDDFAYVAFTRIRQTKIKENVKWILSHVGRQNALPTRVVKYDIHAGKKVGECTMPIGVMDSIYSIYRAYG